MSKRIVSTIVSTIGVILLFAVGLGWYLIIKQHTPPTTATKTTPPTTAASTTPIPAPDEMVGPPASLMGSPKKTAPKVIAVPAPAEVIAEKKEIPAPKATPTKKEIKKEIARKEIAREAIQEITQKITKVIPTPPSATQPEEVAAPPITLTPFQTAQREFEITLQQLYSDLERVGSRKEFTNYANFPPLFGKWPSKKDFYWAIPRGIKGEALDLLESDSAACKSALNIAAKAAKKDFLNKEAQEFLAQKDELEKSFRVKSFWYAEDTKEDPRQYYVIKDPSKYAGGYYKK